MANSDDEKQYPSSNIQTFSGEGFKHHDMVLNLGAKTDAFLSDQTPTPIRLLQKCEEVGLFQDLPPMNPFEETFRKAAENIRSGTAPLEMSSLSVPNNPDDSLHTPHVIFPNPNELMKRRRPISPRDDLSMSIIQHGTDPLDMSLDSGGDNNNYNHNDDDGGVVGGDDDDDEEPGKLVIQQEADTSGDTQVPNLSVSNCDNEATMGTIQFLLRMPNGKVVQLSSLPVEQMNSVTKPNNKKINEKDIPIIKVDSSFLKAVDDGTSQDGHSLNSTSNTVSSGVLISNKNSEVDLCDNIDVNKTTNSVIGKKNNVLSKMALAKQKLKQALMNNSCPATNSKSSSSVISSSGSDSTLVKSNIESSNHFEPESQFAETRKGSSSDDLPCEADWMEEKRKRNRAAAMRCREKRKTWVKELERRANDMLRTNGQLQHEVSMLRDEVAQLKTLLLAHRDCPVTQAMVQGKSAVSGSNPPAALKNTAPSVRKLPSSKGFRSPPSSVVIQSPTADGNPVKPRILLNDPPVKRKRLNSTTSNSSSCSTAVSVVSSPPSSSLHTLVLPPKSSTVLNSSFVNVIPSVLVTNPVTSTSSSLGPSHVIYSQLLPCIPTLTPKPVAAVGAPRQAYILPKSKSYSLEKNIGKVMRPEGKVHTTHLLSTNVIKVNPNVIERDSTDSDIEILDVK